MTTRAIAHEILSLHFSPLEPQLAPPAVPVRLQPHTPRPSGATVHAINRFLYCQAAPAAISKMTPPTIGQPAIAPTPPDIASPPKSGNAKGNAQQAAQANPKPNSALKDFIVSFSSMLEGGGAQ